MFEHSIKLYFKTFYFRKDTPLITLYLLRLLNFLTDVVIYYFRLFH